MSGRRSRRYLTIASAIVIAAVLISAGLFLTIGQAAKSGSATETSSTTMTTIVTITNNTMTVDGSPYYADNVTNLMQTDLTFHFDNGSVAFLGVEFQTICTTWVGHCPGVPPPPANTTFVVPTGPGITLNVTFPDHGHEMIAGVFPIVPVYFHVFSLHTNPQAGVLIVCGSSGGCKSYLLVSVS